MWEDTETILVGERKCYTTENKSERGKTIQRMSRKDKIEITEGVDLEWGGAGVEFNQEQGGRIHPLKQREGMGEMGRVQSVYDYKMRVA